MDDITYAGTWKIYLKDNMYQGELHYNKDEKMIALVIKVLADENHPFPTAAYRGKIPFIQGTLFNGAHVLLYDCDTGRERTEIFQYTEQVIYAKFAFWGLSIESLNDLVFKKVRFELTDTLTWADLCDYKWEMKEDGSQNLIWNHKNAIKVRVNNDLSATIKPMQENVGRYNIIRKNDYLASQYIDFDFEFSSYVRWERILQEVESFKYLIGLGIGHSVALKRIWYYHDSIKEQYSDNEGELHEYPVKASVMIGTMSNNQDDQETLPFNYTYRLEDITNGNIVNIWFDNYGKLKPVLDLYFLAISYNNVTAEMRFLNIVQALETFHARFVTDNAKAYIKKVDSAIKSNKCPHNWGDFLCNSYQKSHTGSIYLISRLADLSYSDGEMPFHPGSSNIPDSYMEKVVKTRNYYTHYGESLIPYIFSVEELPWVTEELRCLLEYHILKLIGFDEIEIHRALLKKIDDINRNYNMSTKTIELNPSLLATGKVDN